MRNTLMDAIRKLAPGAAALAFFAIAASAGAQALTEGTNYVRLKNPMPVETGKNIEVIEFFSYGCPHCGELEPVLQGWLKNKPADITFRRIPVMFQPRWENLAKGYYTLEALNEDKLSPEVFVALHSRNMPLWNEKDFLDWVATKGVDRKKAEELFNSFAIVGKVNRAKQLAASYQIQSVPTIIVDGKYATGPEKLPGGHAGMPPAIEALVQKARAERPKS
jgi:protein dithiol oxidoreductase (disulfide-forming)